MSGETQLATAAQAPTQEVEAKGYAEGTGPEVPVGEHQGEAANNRSVERQLLQGQVGLTCERAAERPQQQQGPMPAEGDGTGAQGSQHGQPGDEPSDPPHGSGEALVVPQPRQQLQPQPSSEGPRQQGAAGAAGTGCPPQGPISERLWHGKRQAERHGEEDGDGDRAPQGERQGQGERQQRQLGTGPAVNATAGTADAGSGSTTLSAQLELTQTSVQRSAIMLAARSAAELFPGLWRRLHAHLDEGRQVRSSRMPVMLVLASLPEGHPGREVQVRREQGVVVSVFCAMRPLA